MLNPLLNIHWLQTSEHASWKRLQRRVKSTNDILLKIWTWRLLYMYVSPCSPKGCTFRHRVILFLIIKDGQQINQIFLKILGIICLAISYYVVMKNHICFDIKILLFC